MKKNSIQIKNCHARILLLILTVFLLVDNFNANGQMIVSGGTTVKIILGTAMMSNENLTMQSGGALDNQGTVILKKNLDNQNVTVNSLGLGTFVFSGSAGQSIGGQNMVQNLTENNATGLTVAGNTRVNGVLTMTSGKISLGSNNLVLGTASTVAGLPDASSMVVATGTGQLSKEFASAGSFTFPVGDATGTAEYSPVTVAFNSGSFAAGSYTGINLVNTQYPGTTASYLTRYWTVTQSGITGFSCNATFQYSPADIAGTESSIFCFNVDPVLPWTAYNASNTATHQITAHGLSAFGIFTGNVGNAAVPPAIRSLQDKTVASTMNDCADALQTLLIAGNGTTYLVQNGGSVEHIAGTNIRYLPGTRVEPGGHMHGHISNNFCTPYIHPGAAPLVADNGDQADREISGQRFFKVYPNPTSGLFTLELKGDGPSSPVHVEIFGILGDRILTKDLLMERKQEFSLADKPTGVYIIHVNSGTDSMTEKIIKK